VHKKLTKPEKVGVFVVVTTLIGITIKIIKRMVKVVC